MKKSAISVMLISLAMVLSLSPVFAQGDTSPAKEEAAPVAAPAASPQESVKATELSIYGEVQAVNAAASSMNVQYYDYDNDEEKAIEITVDKDTKLENAKAIDEIKKGDWVDVTYTSSGAKNMAKMVSVEKEEPMLEETAPEAAEE